MSRRTRYAALAELDLEALDRPALERVARLGLELLDKVDAVDLTPRYDYGHGLGEQNRNRRGELTAEAGSRWLTPRELVDVAALEVEGLVADGVDP